MFRCRILLLILLFSLPVFIFLDTPGNVAAQEMTVVENVYENILPVNFLPPDNKFYTPKIFVTVKLSDSKTKYYNWMYSWSNSREIPEEGWQTFTFGIDGRYKTDFSGYTGEWYLHIKAVDENGKVIYSCSDKYLIDTTPPILLALDLEVLGSNIIRAKGKAVDNESGLDSSPFRYKCNGEVLNSLWAKGEVFISTLQPNTLYYLQFQARDAVTNISEYSEPVGIYTWAEVPELMLGEVTHSSVEVKVCDNNPDYTKYHLEYGDNEFFTDSKKVTFIGPTYTVADLACSTTYYFRIQAENGDGVLTGWSPPVTTTTLLGIPELKVNNQPDQVNLTWEKVKGALGYKIYRDGELLVSLGDVNTYADFTASPPVINPGEVTASSGSKADYVLLQLKGAQVNIGSLHEYYIVAFNKQEEGLPSSVITGYRIPGPLVVQWQCSRDDSGDNFVDIPNAVTSVYRDTSAPDYIINPPEVIKVIPINANCLEVKFSPGWVTPGEARYYRAVLKALGVDVPVITNVVKGFRSDVLSPIDKYEIYRAEGESQEYQLIGYSSEPVYRDYLLAPNTRYFYKVKVRTQEGRSSALTENYGCAYTLAEDPQMLWISQVTAGEIVFEIIAVDKQKEAEYKIEVKKKGAGIEGITAGCSDFSFKVKDRKVGGLEPDQEYEVWVITRNKEFISNSPVKMIDSIYTKNTDKKKKADNNPVNMEYTKPKQDVKNQRNQKEIEYLAGRHIINYIYQNHFFNHFSPVAWYYERFRLLEVKKNILQNIVFDKLLIS